MKALLRNTTTVVLALGIMLGASVPYGACKSHCCCHSGMAAASGASHGDVIASAGNCCCGTVSDYRGGSTAATVTAADEPHGLFGTEGRPAPGIRLAGIPALPHAQNFSACNSPPIFMLVSSYLC